MNFEAILFDCDGVLVDSEAITNGVLRDMLDEMGWRLSTEECMRQFVGKAVKDERALIEARTGQPLTEDWMARFRERRNDGLMRHLQPIEGAVSAVALLHERFEGRIACASGVSSTGGAVIGKKAGEPKRLINKLNVHAIDIVRDPSNSSALISPSHHGPSAANPSATVLARPRPEAISSTTTRPRRTSWSRSCR